MTQIDLLADGIVERFFREWTADNARIFAAIGHRLLEPIFEDVSAPRIDQFSGPHRFLSNFFKEPDQLLTIEHLYQASKTEDASTVSAILAATSPRRAKKLGRQIPTEMIRRDWEVHRLRVMAPAVYKKFQHSRLRHRLDETGDAILIEGNTWGDSFWGVDLSTDRGSNWLGTILMNVRALNRGYR